MKLFCHNKGYIVDKWSFHCINYSVADCLKAWLQDRMQICNITRFDWICSVALTLHHWTATLRFCNRLYLKDNKTCIGKLSPDHADIIAGFTLQSLTVGGWKDNTKNVQNNKTNKETGWIINAVIKTVSNKLCPTDAGGGSSLPLLQ